MRVDTTFPTPGAVTGLLLSHALTWTRTCMDPRWPSGVLWKKMELSVEGSADTPLPCCDPSSFCPLSGGCKHDDHVSVSAQALCPLLKVVMSFRAQCALEIDLFLTGSLAEGVRWGLRVNSAVPALAPLAVAAAHGAM